MKYFLFLIFLHLTIGQYISNKECPEFEVTQDFDVTKYLGKWYELYRYEIYFEKDGDCCWAAYSTNPNGTIKVYNSYALLPNTARKGIEGYAILTNPSVTPHEAKLNVSFNGVEPNTSNYWILGTDYDNYSIVYNCRNLKGKAAEAAWILSRETIISPNVLAVVDKIIDKYLIRSQLRKTEQDKTKCNY